MNSHVRTFASIDPGMSTGIVLWTSFKDGPFIREDYWQITGGLQGFMDFVAPKGHLPALESWGCEFIVSEQFIPDGRATHLEHFEPIRIEGYIEGIYGGQVFYQRNSAMSGVSDKTLKNHDLWLTGSDVQQPDANDVISATKHGLAWMKENHRPSLENYWRNDDWS